MNLWLVIAPALLALPAAALWTVLADEHSRPALGTREALLWTAAIWAGFSSAVVQLLSLGAGHDLFAPASGHLNRHALAIVWLIPALAGAGILWLRRRQLVAQIGTARSKLDSLTGLDRYLAAAIAACAALVALVALIGAPTTWDSMVYHLARVAAWLQLGGVAHYATHAEPQLFQPPGAELLIAQLQALTGGDRYAALVQTFAFVLWVAGASLIARQLGGDRRAQLLAGFLVATAPMAILQGSSTQNDLIVGAWLMIAASLALAIDDQRRLAVPRALVASLAVALAILTKGTAWIYLPPILLLLAWAILKRVGPLRALALAAAGLAIVLALNAGQWQKNHETYGKFVYSGSGFYDYANDSHSPGALVSNLVRNAALYIETPSRAINRRPSGWLREGLNGLGINPDDPATTFPGQLFNLERSGPSESHAGSIVLFVLMLWALALALLHRGFRTRRRLIWAAIVITEILTFALLIKWQTWHSRLHLPVLLLSLPLVAVALTRVPVAERSRRWLACTVVVVSSLLAPFYLLMNVDRPLIGYAGHQSILTTPREQQYFNARPELRQPYLAAIRYLDTHSIDRLAFYGGFDDWYYPFNALMGSGAHTGYDFVPNLSARYPQPSAQSLEAVACINCDATKQAVLTKFGLVRVPLASPPPPDQLELWVRRR